MLRCSANATQGDAWSGAYNKRWRTSSAIVCAPGANIASRRSLRWSILPAKAASDSKNLARSVITPRWCEVTQVRTSSRATAASVRRKSARLEVASP